MAVRQYAKGGQNFKSFSSRLPGDIYEKLNDWAWENRLTLAAAVSELLQKALKAEGGEDYIRRDDAGNTSSVH